MPNLIVAPAGSDLDLSLVEQTSTITAVIEEIAGVSLTLNENGEDITLRVVATPTTVALAVATNATPVSLSISTDDTVELTVSELAVLAPTSLSPSFSYNADGTVNVITYAGGSTKTLTWLNGLLTTSTSRNFSGVVTATRVLTYNASGQLLSVLDS